MRLILRASLLTLTCLTLSSLANSAHAQYLTFSGPLASSGFVANSALDAGAVGASYLAAQGATFEFIDFTMDINGNPAPNGSINGSLFSNNVVFSSMVSSAFGGVNSPNIFATGSGILSEVGPDGGGFNGILNIDFLAVGNSASAVGFGPVELNGVREEIRVYDENNLLQATYTADPSVFSFFGIAQQLGGPRIGRVELDGAFFAIQDIQFAAAGSSVPEPGTIALLAGTAIPGVTMFLRRKRSR